MTTSIERLVGIYNAKGTLVGELAYLVGKRLGRAHCGLCDITHDTFTTKDEWRECRRDLPVPFDAIHLEDRDTELVAATEGRTPCVVAETTEGRVVLLGPQELDACDGSPRRLVTAIEAAAAASGLDLTPPA